jgi:hypothetical protein
LNFAPTSLRSCAEVDEELATSFDLESSSVTQ